MKSLPSDFAARGAALSTAVADCVDGFGLTPLTSNPAALALATAQAQGRREGREQALAEHTAKAQRELADRLRRATARDRIASEARDARDAAALCAGAKSLLDMLHRRG